MLIANNQFFLKTNEYGQISSIKFYDQEILFQDENKLNQSFKMVWPILLEENKIHDNFWNKLNWEWIRQDQSLTLLATHFSNEAYPFSIDIQCFITLDNNLIKIQTLFSNVGHSKATFNFALWPTFNTSINSILTIANIHHKLSLNDSLHNLIYKNIETKKIVLKNEQLKITTQFNANYLQLWKPNNHNFIGFKVYHHFDDEKLITLDKGQQWTSKITIKVEQNNN